MDWTQAGSAGRQERTSDNVNVQGSEAWLRWRNRGLGSSDAAVLLGWSPWKTIDELYQEKIGKLTPSFSPRQISAMARGKQLEPEIRRWYEEMSGRAFPDGIAEHPRFPFMRVSFDGINRHALNTQDDSHGRIIEIKAPNAKDHAMAKSGEVPEKYIAQVQWQLLIADLPWADYVSFGTDQTYAVVPLKADPMIQEQLLSRARLFWEIVEQKRVPTWERFFRWSYPLKAPIDLSDPPQLEEQKIEGMVAEALSLRSQLDELEARFDSLKEKLKRSLGDDEKRVCGEAVFGWQTRKGAVDYGKIPELEKVDLEAYRKADVRAFYFKRTGS